MIENKRITTVKLVKALPSFFATMAAAAFSPLFMFFQNAGEAHFGDVAPTMLIFMAVGAVLFTAALLLTRSHSKAGLISTLFLLVFLNYASLESAIQMLLPSLRYWHIMPFFVVLLLHLGWFVWKKIPLDLTEIIVPVVAAVFGVLILLNGVMSIPAMTTRIRAEREAKRQAEQAVVAENAMPNFYFLMFDEFSTVPFMQKYFDYDNTQLLTELEKLGFNISQTGHNSTYATAAITANLVNLEYVAKYEDSAEKTFSMRSDNKVFPILREAGYTIVSVVNGEVYGLTDIAGGASAGAVTMSGETMHMLLMNATAMYPMMQQYYPEAPRKILEDFNYVKNPSNFEATNQFVLFHIDCPHPPFYFNADGSLLEYVTSEWDDPKNYLNQYIFASNQMLEIAESITENDPNAVIWLLSDHGARASTDPGAMIFAEEDMCNFFSAVYFQGEKLDIEELSGVNTFRLILNKLLGMNMEMIPLPD